MNLKKDSIVKNQDIQEIGLQIYRARKDKGFSSKALGDECNVTGEHIVFVNLKTSQ